MRWLSGVFWLVLSASVAASEPMPIVVENAMIRDTSKAGVATAGYLKITNIGEKDDILIEASTDAAEMVQIHEMLMSDGVMSMREVDGGLVIPAGGTIVLAPRGLHLMIMKTKRDLPAGTDVPVKLVFEEAGEVHVDFIVQPLGVIMKAQ